MLSRRASYDCLTTWTLVVASVSCGDVILLEYENTFFSRSPRVHTFCHTKDAASRIHSDTGLFAPMLENTVFGKCTCDHAFSFTTSHCAIFDHEKLSVLRKCRKQRMFSWKTLARNYHHGKQQTIAWKHWRLLLLVEVAVSGLSWRKNENTVF